MRLGQFFPSSVAVGLLASVWVIYARNLYIAQGSIIRVFCVNLCGFGGGGWWGFFNLYFTLFAGGGGRMVRDIASSGS